MRAVEDWAAVGDLVRRARVAWRLSQGELASRLGLDRTAVVRMEAGTRSVSALEMARLAGVTQLPISYFISRPTDAVAAYRSSAAEVVPDSESAAERDRFFLDVELEEHARDADWLRREGLIQPADVLPSVRVDSREDAEELARQARVRIGIPTDPLGSMLTVAEKFGLYIKVVPRGTGGASLQVDDSLSVAVVGSQSDPGRRRSTAAHELGHHLWGDVYSTDVGISLGSEEKERFVDAFATELLLPSAAVGQVGERDEVATVRSSLIELSARYRVSWSLAVTSARKVLALDGRTVQQLVASPPMRGDFLEVVGFEPRYDLEPSSAGPGWRKAVLAAYRSGSITPRRAVEMVNGSIAVEDLPLVASPEKP